MTSIYYKGFLWDLTDAEYDALAAYGSDVVAGRMTEDDAAYAILLRTEHAKRLQIPMPHQEPPRQLWAY